MICVIDTSVLITFYELEKVELLNQLFNEVYVPTTVEQQFLSRDQDKKLDFLFRFQETHTWFKKCQTYSSDMISLLSSDKGIDPGEREALAQFKKLQEDLGVEPGRIWCIMDEKYGRKVAANMDIALQGTLLLLARLARLGHFDYEETVSRIASVRRFSRKAITEAYAKAQATDW